MSMPFKLSFSQFSMTFAIFNSNCNVGMIFFLCWSAISTLFLNIKSKTLLHFFGPTSPSVYDCNETMHNNTEIFRTQNFAISVPLCHKWQKAKIFANLFCRDSHTFVLYMPKIFAFHFVYVDFVILLYEYMFFQSLFHVYLQQLLQFPLFFHHHNLQLEM